MRLYGGKLALVPAHEAAWLVHVKHDMRVRPRGTQGNAVDAASASASAAATCGFHCFPENFNMLRRRLQTTGRVASRGAHWCRQAVRCRPDWLERPQVGQGGSQ